VVLAEDDGFHEDGAGVREAVGGEAGRGSVHAHAVDDRFVRTRPVRAYRWFAVAEADPHAGGKEFVGDGVRADQEDSAKVAGVDGVAHGAGLRGGGGRHGQDAAAGEGERDLFGLGRGRGRHR
jgi:hypothetical protein